MFPNHTPTMSPDSTIHVCLIPPMPRSPYMELFKNDGSVAMCQYIETKKQVHKQQFNPIHKNHQDFSLFCQGF